MRLIPPLSIRSYDHIISRRALHLVSTGTLRNHCVDENVTATFEFTMSTRLAGPRVANEGRKAARSLYVC